MKNPLRRFGLAAATPGRTLFKQLSLLALTAALGACGQPDGGGEGAIKGLPWQIETFDDGSSQVFDIRLGHTTLEQAQQLLGPDTESAIIIDQQNKASMELYASHYKAGPLAGKLVLLADIGPSQLAQMIQNLEQGDYMASGARKLFPTAEDWVVARQAKISGINFIPAANLDEGIIFGRFGEDAEVLSSEKLSHYLYPAKGLDVALSEDGKEVLQYIAPRHFHKLRQPIVNNPEFKPAEAAR